MCLYNPLEILYYYYNNYKKQKQQHKTPNLKTKLGYI